MGEQERMARALEATLRERGIAARASGAGVHWQVDGGEPDREWKIHCFWYERAIHGLMLGMNPANARTSHHTPVKPYGGPEYLVVLRELVGRTREVDQALTAVRVWLDRGNLVVAAPFIDDKPRAMRAIAKTLDPRLRWDIEGDPSCSLWIEDDARSCEARRAHDDDSVSCRFLYGQQPIATAIDRDVAALSKAWLLDRISIRDLLAHEGIEGEWNADQLEIDPAQWHWAHVRDRIANPDDVLAPLRPLIETFAESPIASRFFSFSSLNRFCFSASSHYPWVDDGLPIIAPGADGYVADRTRRDLASTVAYVESVLGGYSVSPFFGTAVDRMRPLLAEKLPAFDVLVEQQHGWRRLIVRDAAGRTFHVPSHLELGAAVAAALAFFAS